jgi:hypothetical protein
MGAHHAGPEGKLAIIAGRDALPRPRRDCRIW